MTTLIKYTEVKMSKQTSIEWLVEQYEKAFTLNVNTVMTSIIEQAKQMHKDEIVKAWIATDNELQRLSAEEYYQKTYGSNHIVDTNEMIDHIGDANKMVEISDEEIEKEADNTYVKYNAYAIEGFIDGAKWYREQLKK